MDSIFPGESDEFGRVEFTLESRMTLIVFGSFEDDIGSMFDG